MEILLKLAILVIVACGVFLVSWNTKAAAEGDKMAHKHLKIGAVIFAVGILAGLSLWLLGVL